MPRLVRLLLLLSPALAIFLTVYLGGLAMVALVSLGFDGDRTAGLGFKYYLQLFDRESLLASTLRTARVSLATVIATALLGFPVAKYLAREDARFRTLIVMCVLSPLMVSTIGRIFGWIALFGPGSFLAHLGQQYLGLGRTGLLYTEFAMVVGLANLLLPFMVLSITASLLNADPDISKAAYSLGASPLTVFRRIDLPMAMPGLISGALVVFSLSVSNFVTAALLGGSGRNVVAYEVYLDSLVYFEPFRGAALAMLILAVILGVSVLSLIVGGRQQRKMAAVG